MCHFSGATFQYNLKPYGLHVKNAGWERNTNLSIKLETVDFNLGSYENSAHEFRKSLHNLTADIDYIHVFRYVGPSPTFEAKFNEMNWH